MEGVFRARKQASPRAWGGYDEFSQTVELTILILATVMGAAFFGVGFVIGVDNVLFKALFAFYCLHDSSPAARGRSQSRHRDEGTAHPRAHQYLV